MNKGGKAFKVCRPSRISVCAGLNLKVYRPSSIFGHMIAYEGFVHRCQMGMTFLSMQHHLSQEPKEVVWSLKVTCRPAVKTCCTWKQPSLEKGHGKEVLSHADVNVVFCCHHRDGSCSPWRSIPVTQLFGGLWKWMTGSKSSHLISEATYSC